MKNECEVVEIITPQKCVLNGLWFGSQKAKRAIIFVHGLTSSAFSSLKLIVPVTNRNTAVVTFSNRGHDQITKLRKINKRKKKGYTSKKAGATHEIFTECADDIQGAINFVKSKGVNEIYLVGHSTGCQKSVYYLSRRGKQEFIKGVILMAPMSDYAGALKFDKGGQLERATKVAKKLTGEGKPHKILPLDVWPHMHDAQRFLSLYTPDSEEEIFNYCQPNKYPKTFKSVKTPMLIIIAEEDEYKDRPVKKIENWFTNSSNSKDLQISIVRNAPHSFQKYESDVVEKVDYWLKKRSEKKS